MRIASTQRTVEPKISGKIQPSRSPESPVSEDRLVWSIASSSIASVGAGAVALNGATQVDKFKHIGVSGAATVALGALGLSPGVAAVTVFVGASVGKELVYDLLLGRGHASWLDAAANLAGALAGYALLKTMQGDNDETGKLAPFVNPGINARPDPVSG